ncbi:hypothetical protein [Streptomyces nodosus]|nr:hypothetical protein [Streptomyces nodosus]MBB4792809.1 hypothetical protein [Streptomyces nodosus]
MTPRLCTPSAFRTLRAALLPPVLTTAALLGAGTSCAYGMPGGQGTGPSYGARHASSAVQPMRVTGPSDAAAGSAPVSRCGSTAPVSAAPPAPPIRTAGHPASAAPPVAEPEASVAAGRTGALEDTSCTAAARGDTAPAAPALVLAASHLSVGSHHGPPGPEDPRFHRHPVVSPSESSPDPSRAGSRAGVGRPRPGRPDPEPENEADPPVYTDQDPTASANGTPEPTDRDSENPDLGAVASADAGDPPGASAAPTPPQQAAGPTRAAAPSGSMSEILPLATGLMLIGSGLALALLALRLRRE